MPHEQFLQYSQEILKSNKINNPNSIISYILSWKGLLLKFRDMDWGYSGQISRFWEILVYGPISILRPVLKHHKTDDGAESLEFNTFINNLLIVQTIYQQMIHRVSLLEPYNEECRSNNIFNLLLNLGDVYRYEEDMKLSVLNGSVSSEELFLKSEACYLEAIHICPDNGQLFNQLSIIHGNLRFSHHKNHPTISVHYFESLYYQLKSIHTVSEFPQGTKNWHIWSKKIHSAFNEGSFPPPSSWIDSITIQCLFKIVHCHSEYSAPSIKEIICLFSMTRMLMDHRKDLSIDICRLNALIELGWACLGSWIEQKSTNSYSLSELLLFCFITQVLSPLLDPSWIKILHTLGKARVIIERWCSILNLISSHKQQKKLVGKIGNVLPLCKFVSQYYEILMYLNPINNIRYVINEEFELEASSLEYLWEVHLSKSLFYHSRQLAKKNHDNCSLFYHPKKKIFYPFVKRQCLDSPQIIKSQTVTATVTFDCEFLMEYFHLVKKLFSSQKYIVYVSCVLLNQIEKHKRNFPNDKNEKIQFIKNRIQKPEKYGIILESLLDKTQVTIPSTNRISSLPFLKRLYIQSYYTYIVSHCPKSKYTAYFASQNEKLLSICRDASIIGLDAKQLFHILCN